MTSMKFAVEMFDRLPKRSKGLLLSIVGVLCLTPDSLLVRQVAHVPNMTVLFYRNMIFAVTMLIGLLVTEKGNSWNKLKGLGKWGLFTGVIFGASLWFIIIGIMNTAAANVLVIQAANPLFAAIFSWVIMREAITKLTFATSMVCVVAIVLIFIGEALKGSSSSSEGDNTLGLIMAVASSISFGLYVVMLRFMAVYQEVEVDMMPCNIIAGIVAMLLSAMMGADPTAVEGMDFIYIGLQGVGVLAIGFMLLTFAPMYIPAPEVSLYTLIETVLGPVWVFLGGYESPTIYAVIGGVLLLGALAVHSYMSLQEQENVEKPAGKYDGTPVSARISPEEQSDVELDGKVVAFQEDLAVCNA